jgi:DNA invertase Pin-like site-specific DNA recombinase
VVEVGYARVSTAEQAQDSHALESQESRLLAAGCDPVFSEVGSGGSDRRKVFQKVWKMVRDGGVQSISVTRIDRISRNLLTLRQFLSDCEARGIVVRAIDQGIFSDTAHGKFALNILGSLAEWELDNLKERVDRGWKFLQENKRAPGVVPFGYVRGEDESYLPARDVQYRDSDKDCWTVALEIIDAVEKTSSIRGAIRELHSLYGERKKGSRPDEDYPRENGLRYWLLNPVLRGHISYYYRYMGRDKVNGRWVQGQKPIILIPNQHEPLISPVRWDGLERILSQRTREREKENWRTKPLAGLVQCLACKGRFRGFTNSRKKGDDCLRLARWYCNNIYLPVPTCENRKGILNESLEDAVHKALAQRAKEIAALIEDEEEEVRVGLADTPEIKGLLGSLASLEAIPSNPAIDRAKEEIREQIEGLRGEQKNSQQVKSLLADELVETLEEEFFWSWLNPVKRRAYYLRFVESVWVLDGGVVAVDLRI